MAEQYEIRLLIKADGTVQAVQNIQKIEQAASNVGRGARQGFGTATRESQNLTTSVSQAQTAVVGLFTAFAGHQAIQAIGQLRQIGDETRFAKLAFEEMAGGPQLAEEALRQLREATRGVIDDVTLMRESSKLQLLGLAEDAVEAGELFSTLSKIAQITGQDVGSALGVFQLTLANMSYQRLDSLGLSVDGVKTRVQELEAAGLSAEEAFRQAVIEGMGDVVETIGAAATAGENAFAKWETKLKNLRNELGLLVSDSVLTALNLAELAATISNASAVGNRGGFPLVGGSWLAGRMATNPGGIAGGAGLAAQLSGLGDRIAFERGFQRLTAQIADSAFASIYDSLISGFDPSAIVASNRQQAILASETRMDLLTRSHDFYYGTRDALGLGPPLYGREDTFTPFGASQLGDLKTLVEPAQAIRDALKEAYERGLVSADTVRDVESNLDAAIQLADEAERAQRAYERMTTSLSGLLGIDVTNPIGVEITDQVAQAMRDAGMDEEQIQAYIDAMDLSTGRQTALSQRFESEVLPGIVAVHEQMGADAAREATLAFQRGLTMVQTNAWGLPDDLLQLSGYRIGDDGNVVSTGLGVVPDNVGAGGITPVRTREEATPFGQLLTEGDAVIAKAGEISTAFLQIPATIQPMTDSVSATVGISDTLKQSLDTMAGQTYELRFVLTANDQQIPALLKDLIRNELVTLNRGTGGRSPGTDPRRSRTTN